MSRDITHIIQTLNRMMSHGIFDAEHIASELRVQGWAFQWDPRNANEQGGVYYVRTPEGREGAVQWYNAESIAQVSGNAGFFIEGTAPQKLFVGWILADQLARIILGRGFDENGEQPGDVYKNVYAAFSAIDTEGHAVELEAAQIIEIPTRERHEEVDSQVGSQGTE